MKLFSFVTLLAAVAGSAQAAAVSDKVSQLIV